MKRLHAVLLFILLPICSTFAFAQTIILVRHAEKVSNAPDAGLSGLGKERADKLARILSDAGVTAIFTSEVERTKQTAAPLAKLLKLDAAVVPAKDTAGLVNKLRAISDNAVVLVVGHSNTIPTITELLLSPGAAKTWRGGPSTTMKDSDYDRMYMVSLNPNGKPRLLILHY